MDNAKQRWSFLIAWVRQARECLDEGHELAYELAELLDEVWELTSETEDVDSGPGSGAHVDEAPGPELDGGDDAGEVAGGLPREREDSQPTVPGLVRGLDGTADLGMRSSRGVPRGTRGRAAAALMVMRKSATTKVVPDGT